MVIGSPDATDPSYVAPRSAASSVFKNMSLPQETIDQLLSGYMDDALSHEEREQLEALLRSDVEVTRQWEELCQQRETLRTIARADRRVRLDAGFADRVLDAAVNQAQAQGLGEDHPLIRLAEQPSTTVTSAHHARTHWGRIAGVCAALAASMLLAVVLWNPRPNDAPLRSLADADSLMSPPRANVPDNDTDQADPGQVPRLAADPSPADNDRDDLLSPLDRSDSERQGSDRPSPSALADASSKNGRAPSSKISDLASSSSPEPERTVGAVMVLEVTLTEAGRSARAVRRALRDAAINLRNEKLVTEDIVGAVNESQLNPDDSLHGAAVMYLEGSAKELDRFILLLCGDRQGIEAVRFGLATELPILNLVKEFQRPVDPQAVRHSTSWIVEGKSPAVSQSLTHALIDRTMIPMSDDVSELGMITAAVQDGLDVMSQLFVIVR